MAEEKAAVDRPVVPSSELPPLAVHVYPNEETVTMVFPTRVQVMMEGHRLVRFEAGPQEVPVRFVEPEMHWYLRANKVKRYEPVLPPAKPPATPQPAEDSEESSEEESASSRRRRR